jgi:hypothetical protein
LSLVIQQKHCGDCSRLLCVDKAAKLVQYFQHRGAVPQHFE